MLRTGSCFFVVCSIVFATTVCSIVQLVCSIVFAGVWCCVLFFAVTIGIRPVAIGERHSLLGAVFAVTIDTRKSQ